MTMKRIYSTADEDKIRMQAFLGEWQRSGFLDAPQAARLQTELRVDLRRTNSAFRALLLLFTALISLAAIALAGITFGLREKDSVAPALFLAAVVYYSLAEYIVEHFKVYRFGVEEVFALSAAASIGIAAGLETSASFGLAVGVLAGLAVYLRFGYLAAAIGAMACAAAIPFQLEFSNELARALAAAVCACAFAGVRMLPSKTEDNRLIQTAAWIGIYVSLNLQLAFAHYDGWFYWATYAMMWILPICGLAMSLRNKERELLDVNVVLGLVTIAINKSYLHLVRRPWDPILFGIFMIGGAVIVRRWLAGGADGQRHGYTPVRLLASDSRALAALGTASALLQPHLPAPAPAKSEPQFGGGRSGGAGASGSF
jgi:hypothetical protein